MLDVQLGRRHRQVATTWNELTGPQMLKVCRLYSVPFLRPTERERALLQVLFQVPARVMRKMNAVQFINLKHLTGFLLEPDKGRPLTAQLLPCLPAPTWREEWFGFRLYGPLGSFINLSFAEFIFADSYFLRYLQTNDEAWLDKLVAVLYRPQRRPYRPQSVGFAGDRREDFNEHLVPARVAYVSRVPHHVKLAVLLWYRGCRRELERRYPRVFESDTEQKAGLSGWQAVLHGLADGVHRLEATASQSLHNVMREMQRVLENYDRAKEAQTAQ